MDQDVKDWIVRHFGGVSSEQRAQIGPVLREILTAQVPMFDHLLQQPETVTFVLRAVVAFVLKAFETGEFWELGPRLDTSGGTMETNSKPKPLLIYPHGNQTNIKITPRIQ